MASIALVAMAVGRWFVVRLEVFAVLVAIGIGTWAAYGVGETWGRSVLALGLFFLGGGFSRIVRELRGG